MDSVNKINYKLSDVQTRSVVLFPSRAQIFKDIKDIDLKPGLNEVTISGLSPTLDEDSVKVEGTGSAIITDISVVSLPNRDIFEEVYPDEEFPEESDEEDAPAISAAKREARTQLRKAADEVAILKDDLDSAEQRLRILDLRSNAEDKMEAEKASRLSDLLATYKVERAQICRERVQAKQQLGAAEESLEYAREHHNKVTKAEAKADQARRQANSRRQKIREKRLEEWRQEKKRIRKERERFWPKYCYSITVTLDVNTMTPMSSRRQSISSDVDVLKVATTTGDADEQDTFQECMSCNLALSYVTSAAKWEPSYDLQLSTTTSTATLCFDAKISNETSETWNNCKISLSTSDAASSGTDSDLPELTPWRIRLSNRGNHFGDEDQITRSRNEVNACQSYFFERRNRIIDHKPRTAMFGRESKPYSVCSGVVRFLKEESRDDSSESDAEDECEEENHEGEPSGPMGFAAMAMAAPAARAVGGASAYAEPDMVDFEDSIVDEVGMVTNYDLPGLKSLAPKATASKQRVARVVFSSVVLSHSVIAKYRPVAYLQAKLKNNSKLTLLRGTAGLTLDGSFMGRTNIPRCTPGDVFTLNLGVDPAVKVSYPKPEVRRATTGVFTKENSSVFARVVVLHNTRAATGKPAQLHVLDQVPVSEDERLRVDLVTPRGLSVGEGSVIAGAPGREEDNRDRDWGKASAQLKKGGEVSWDVKLNPGKMVKLWLEYAVSAPTSDTAVEC